MRLFAEMEKVISETPTEALPAILGHLARLQAQAQLRLVTPTRTTNQEELLTVPEVAERLKLSVYRTYEIVRQGHLKSVKLGKAVRVKLADLAEYVARQALDG